MLHQLLQKFDRIFGFEKARAHCDIPCGIYDPHHAQLAALTVIRMIDLMNDLKQAHGPETADYINNMPRYVMVKEEHAELVKREVRVIFGDYIKKEQVEQYPELPALVHKIMQFGSKARQTNDRDSAVQFVEAINQFAEIFWDTKGVATKKAKAPYNPPLEMVYPAL